MAVADMANFVRNYFMRNRLVGEKCIIQERERTMVFACIYGSVAIALFLWRPNNHEKYFPQLENQQYQGYANAN